MAKDWSKEAQKRGIYVAVVGKQTSTIWGYTTHNPEGGSFGSTCNSGSPKKTAVLMATRNVPADAEVLLVTERWTGSRWETVSETMLP